MSLTRKLCKSLGLTDEQTESIIEAHTEVTENMSAEIKNLKEKSAEFEKMKTDFENLKSENEKIKNAASEYEKLKADFENEKTAFSDFKKDVEAKEKKANQDKSYKKWLMELGHSSDSAEKIMRIDARRPKFNDQNEVEDADGAFKKEIDADWHTEPNAQWTEGTKVPKPPANNGNGENISRARQLAQEIHSQQYGSNNAKGEK